MRHISNYKKYLGLAAFLFLLIALPPFIAEKGRYNLFTLLKPVLKGAVSTDPRHLLEAGYKKLEGENHLLRLELQRLRALFEAQKQPIAAQQHERQGVFAKVLFRDPGSWSSSLWIDVGSETNRQLKRGFVKKNSPVLCGKAVVGAIDYVGKYHSRVRLITDSGLKLSVRAVRVNTAHPLAKGVLQGSGTPLWRKKSQLKGCGFNYDFADEEGPAQDLYLAPLSLIQVHDLLVTTGMDGVFPSGLPVATVTRVYPLKEGAYTYDIEAFPLSGDLEELYYLLVLPPTDFSLEKV